LLIFGTWVVFLYDCWRLASASPSE
jgi:hypothetical protein